MKLDRSEVSERLRLLSARSPSLNILEPLLPISALPVICKPLTFDHLVNSPLIAMEIWEFL